MKKLLGVVFLLLLVVSFISIAPSINAMQIPEGAVVKTANNPDVYIVKYKNGKQFKRLVLNPQVFESYGHLRWEDILTVSQSEMDSFVVSDLVRVDGQTDIYQLVPNGDVGTKVLLESTVGHDLDLVYTINTVDFGNYVEESIIHQVGKAIDMEDRILTVHQILDDYDFTSQNQFIIPEEGNKYFLIEVSITNNGSESLFYWHGQFKLKDKNNYEYKNDAAFKKPSFGDGDLLPTRTIRGFITYEIPRNISDLELIYSSWPKQAIIKL